MDAFCDTNVLIGYVFLLDNLNRYSDLVFRQYSSIFYSKNVKDEYLQVFEKKYQELSKQILDLQSYLNKHNEEFYNLNKIKNEISNLTSKDFLDFLDCFWNTYLEYNYIGLDQICNSLEICRYDLKENTFYRDSKLNEMLTLIDNSHNSYQNIDKNLESLNVHRKDRKIILDAHDFNLKNHFTIDFISFDEEFINGARLIEEFCFNSIKGKHDLFS